MFDINSLLDTVMKAKGEEFTAGLVVGSHMAGYLDLNLIQSEQKNGTDKEADAVRNCIMRHISSLNKNELISVLRYIFAVEDLRDI